jgi:type IV pilus assembly protein PilY1
MNTHKYKGFLAAALVAVTAPFSILSHAEDIDLFVGFPPNTSDLPNVLFVIDNSANWGGNNLGTQPFTNLQNALSSTLSQLPIDRFRVGIMFYTESGEEGESGGYVRAAMRDMNAANKDAYSGLVNSLHPLGDRASGSIPSLAMAEAYRYYSVGTALPSAGVPYAGNKKLKADYTLNTHGTPASKLVYALPDNALESYADNSYKDPLSALSCAPNFIIFISNGTTTESNNSLSKSYALLTQAGGDTSNIPVSPSRSIDSPVDEWARFLKQSPMAVTTYTIDINPASQNQGTIWTEQLKSMARVGGGKYFKVSNSGGAAGSEISNALNSIFSEIQTVNSVFASVSLPVSVNTQGTFLNQVFIGMFRPEQNALPRWLGNLKQYKLGFAVNSTVLQTLDANDNPAINNVTGFIAECARSYWTPVVNDEYWTYLVERNCLNSPKESNTPDGNLVEKGAQGFKLRSILPGSRTVLMASGTSSTSGTKAFIPANVTRQQVGAATDLDRDLIVNWAIGYNNKPLDFEEKAFVPQSAMRPSVHGDIVHSRPVAINYGTDVAPEVVVFYGGNDGMLRAVNGNRTGVTAGAGAGSELWAFMPNEFLDKIKRLRNNDPAVKFPNTQIATSTPKDYGFDGPVVAYQEAVSGGGNTTDNVDTVQIFASMRRGGRSIYSFDVTNRAIPVLKWKLGCSNGVCTTGYDKLGQTWASPSVVKAASNPGTPLLVFGGGYNACQDTHPQSCTSALPGNEVFVASTLNGSRLNYGVGAKSFLTESGIVADITIVKDKNGFMQYGYTADLGGNVYRLSGIDANTPINGTDPKLWTLTKIASLGCGTASTSCSFNRKFQFAPDIVFDGKTSYLLLGSGDREKPLGQGVDVDNYFFMLKDQPASSTGVLQLSDLTPITSGDPSKEDLAASSGWYLQMADGEQVVTSAITVFGVVTFSTHRYVEPQPGVCSNNLGEANVYNINYENAASENGTLLRSEVITGGGLPPSPVAGMVRLDDGTLVPFLIGGSPDSPLAGQKVSAPALGKKPLGRVYWNIEELQR